MKRLVLIGVAASFLVSGLTSGVAVAQTDVASFPLIKAAPADAFITVAAKANPERKFIDAYWDRVIQEFLDQGILEDIWDMITDLIPDENLDAVEEAHDRISVLFEKIDWGELFHREMIYTGRFHAPAPGSLTHEGLLIGRMGKEKAASNYAGLKALLEEAEKMLVAHVGEGIVAISETKEDGLTITCFGPQEMPDVGITLAHWKDLILISTGGNTILHEAVDLLKGTSKKTGLVETARFKKAFADLPPAEDELVFFDIEGMLGTIRSVVGKISAGMAAGEQATTQPAGDTLSDEAKWMAFVSTLLNDVSIADYMAAVEWTDGYQVHNEVVTTLRPNATDNPLRKILASSRPLEKFEKYIPKEANDFSCSSGVSFSKLYRYALGFVKENVPGGKDMIAEFEKVQKEDWELNIDQDILSLFDGETASAMMGKDWFLMLKVTDEEKAAKQVSSLLKRLNNMMGEQNALMMTEVTVAGEKGFTQVMHPFLMMMGGGLAPVLGCAEGHLIIGSSTDAVATCLKTGRGKHPNITENERWQKEGLAPKSGAVDAISFTDESNMAKELQELIGLASMGMGFVAMFAQGEAPPEIRSVLSAVPPILGKLGPVVGKLDFYQSSSQYSTFNGDHWRTRSVQNYKKSVPKPPAAEDESESKGEAGDL
ncbi:MAG: DUF3352 domain-containing protein [Phycisphaerae bacterium]|nr:DUF3352 domain-containing protein [Phycisphaerae bacterium]